MNENQKAFFDNLEEFKRINLASMFPGLSPGDMCILKTMNEHNQNRPIRVSDIVERLRVPAPAVSRNLKSLEQKGLIERRVDETDRRNTFVELTEAGVVTSKEIETKMSSFADAVFERIGEDSFKQLNNYMRQLIEASKEELAKRKIEKKGE